METQPLARSATGTFLLLVLFASEATAIVFTQHPTDVTVTEGDDATFRCGTDLPCLFFYWGRYQAPDGDFSYVSKCMSSYEPQYSIQKADNVYSLQVRDVSLEDSGTVYECWQYNQAGGGWLKSTNATLTVLPLTTVSSGWEPPVCSMDPPGPHRVGDTVSLQCSYPASHGQGLVWTAARNWSEFDKAAAKKPSETNRLQWTLSERDNFAEFTCQPESRSAHSPRGRGNCTVIPLAIPTNVTISPAGSQVVAEGDEVLFRCSAEAVPEVTSYTWFITKDGTTAEPNQRFIISSDDSGMTFRILGASREDDGIEMVCEASNEINITGYSPPFILTVRPAPTGEAISSTFQSALNMSKKGEKSAKEPDDLSNWSHMALVIGIMLCVVVLFVAVGMGVLYVGWRRRMNETAKDATSSATSPPLERGRTFSLHDPEADIMLGDGCVRACAVIADGSPLASPRGSALENPYTENVYMEILGGQPHPCAPAPAHQRAVENEPTYERHF